MKKKGMEIEEKQERKTLKWRRYKWSTEEVDEEEEEEEEVGKRKEEEGELLTPEVLDCQKKSKLNKAK